MASVKHKLIFMCGGKGGSSQANVTAGWTVTFYVNAADNDNIIATGKASRMQQLLRGMMSDWYAISFVRIQQVTDDGAATRNTFVYSFPVQTRDGLIPSGSQPGGFDAGDNFEALNIRLQTADGPHRSFLLRGIPDGVTEGGGAYVPSAPFNAAFSIFRAAMLNNNDSWAMRLQTSGPRLLITNIDVSTPSRSIGPVITVANSGPPLTEGQRVRISPAPGWPGLSGVWSITGPSAITGGVQTCQLKPKRGKSVGTAFALTSLPYLSVLTFSLTNFGDAQPLYGTHRLVGRPFGQQRGRRKKSA